LTEKLTGRFIGKSAKQRHLTVGRVLSVTSLDLSHALSADLFRRHARSPKGHGQSLQVHLVTVEGDLLQKVAVHTRCCGACQFITTMECGQNILCNRPLRHPLNTGISRDCAESRRKLDTMRNLSNFEGYLLVLESRDVLCPE
jgi:hypothetical protein